MEKIFNDPVYGFVSVPYGLLLDLIDHPYFQRLRRIRQLGLASYVYPGALHTRFHHALGALHLMRQAIQVLRDKGVEITEEECEAVSAAILLHDIGHGPFSHALEHTLIDLHHEQISMMFMDALNRQFGGKLELTQAIFEDRYPKKFLHQLVSGQLDMDRMDYLNRDSFFTGVSEGVIGYDRIIKMLAVRDGELVVEEKGIYSIEKFLIARRLMYWQVYLHKTSVAAEQMLIQLLRRARILAAAGVVLPTPPTLQPFLYPVENEMSGDLLKLFSRLDDSDIIAVLKYWNDSDDPILALLASGLLDRQLFRLEWHKQPIDPVYVEFLRARARERFSLSDEALIDYLVLSGRQTNQAYDDAEDVIKILFKNDRVRPFSECADVPVFTHVVTKYFICYPKLLTI